MSGQTRGIADTIHVHGKVEWGLEFVPTTDIWKRARLFDIDDSHNILIPSEEHCVLITAAHAIFESHMISLADVFQIEGITLKFPETDWQLLAKTADQQGWIGAFYTFLVGVNAISLFLYDHTLISRSMFSYIHALCKPLDKMMGIDVVVKSFSQVNRVPLHYPMAIVGLFFIGVAARRFSVSTLIGTLDAIVHRITKHHIV